VECDATEFERLVRRAAHVDEDECARCLVEAMSLYSDHYLAGEVAGGWRDEEQDRLRGLYAEAGLRLGALLQASGREAEAAAVYERLLLHEPLLEAAHRRLMSHWAATGDRVRAIRHYERLAARLSIELDLAPDDETTALYESVRNADSRSPLSAE
jgi:two-component SAPR family response regulator